MRMNDLKNNNQKNKPSKNQKPVHPQPPKRGGGNGEKIMKDNQGFQ